MAEAYEFRQTSPNCMKAEDCHCLFCCDSLGEMEDKTSFTDKSLTSGFLGPAKEALEGGFPPARHLEK